MRLPLWRPKRGPDERTRMCLCPPHRRTDACVEGHLIEEHPFFVEPATNLPWEYAPRGPYRLQRWHESGDLALVTQLAAIDDLLAAVDLFVSRFLPLLPGYQAFVIDEAYNLVLGYSSSSRIMEKYGHEGWFGVQSAFDVLTPLVGDPMTVAIWESMARDSAR